MKALKHPAGADCLRYRLADGHPVPRRPVSAVAIRYAASIIAACWLGGARCANSAEPEADAAQLQARGVVRAAEQAKISVDLAAPLAKVGFREGQKFRKGEVLLAFDCRRQLAELTSAVAQQRETTVMLESALFLEKRGAGSRQDMEMSRAKAEKASADVEAIRARTEQCNIVAPYDGYVVELGIQAYELPTPGKPLLSIVSTGDAEIELIVPSSWLSWLKRDFDFKFFVDETQKSYPGGISRLGAAVDTVSQTIKVYGKFSNPPPDVLPGMSGTVRFQHGHN